MPAGHDGSTDDEADVPGAEGPATAAGDAEGPEPSAAEPVVDPAAEPVEEGDPQVDEEEYRPEDVREGVVDLVAYVVGAASLILLGYFTQRDVLTWTRGPFVVVCVILAVHWVGRRVRARKTGDAR